MGAWVMQVGKFLIVEGLLVGLLVAMRFACLRMIDLDSIPVVVRGRVAVGNRVAPVVGVVALAMIICGVVVSIAGR